MGKVLGKIPYEKFDSQQYKHRRFVSRSIAKYREMFEHLSRNINKDMVLPTRLKVILQILIVFSILHAVITDKKCDPKTEYTITENDKPLQPLTCKSCPVCMAGEEPPIRCGQTMENSQSNRCKDCIEGKTFSSERSVNPCQPCKSNKCRKYEIVNGKCDRYSDDTSCSGICNSGYMMNDDKTACVPSGSIISDKINLPTVQTITKKHVKITQQFFTKSNLMTKKFRSTRHAAPHIASSENRPILFYIIMVGCVCLILIVGIGICIKCKTCLKVSQTVNLNNCNSADKLPKAEEGTTNLLTKPPGTPAHGTKPETMVQSLHETVFCQEQGHQETNSPPTCENTTSTSTGEVKIDQFHGQEQNLGETCRLLVEDVTEPPAQNSTSTCIGLVGFPKQEQGI